MEVENLKLFRLQLLELGILLIAKNTFSNISQSQNKKSLVIFPYGEGYNLN